MRSRRTLSSALLGIALWALAVAVPVHVAQAQPAAVGHLVALGPGVNRGQIDNFSGAQSYYFFAGPGHIDIDMAFAEMGIFGSPFRQALTLDFYSEDGKLASHNAIVSQGSIARVHTDGDIANRQKFILVVTAQQGAIRLGGYFEIEAKGAVGFEGPTVGPGVKPVRSEPLVK